MTLAVALAFLHHAAAFTLVGSVLAELVLLRGELTLPSARALVRVDALYGAAATIVLVAGFLRVFYTEKGGAYYFASGTFIAKLALFAIAGGLSIYPTMKFLAWRRGLAEKRVPSLDPRALRTLRTIVHIELVLFFGMMLCAVMMARGIGYFG